MHSAVTRIWSKCLRPISVFLTVLLAASCNHSGLVADVAVKLVRPDDSVWLGRDTTFCGDFPEVLHCVDIQIVKDTILILQNQVGAVDSSHFKAYSTRTFRHLGSFIRKGRGPGELVSPHIARTSSDEEYLSISDNATGLSWWIDVPESIKSGQTKVVQTTNLPVNTVDWVPLSELSQLTLNLEDNELVSRIIDQDGNALRTFHPYRGIDAERCMTHLSCMLTNNGRTGTVAMGMVFFPQITFIDTDSGEHRSIAVDKDWRNWKQVLSSMLDKDSIEYYAGITSTPDCIFATYWGVPIGKTLEGGHGSSIHVFDWKGHFLYEIRVKEEIGHLAFDKDSACLYCIDQSEDRIVRYDLSGLLPKR